jgi:predicted Zn-dependent peptidase
MLLALEGSYNRMTRLARHELFLREFVPVDKTIAEVERITAEEIRDAAEELFKAEQHSLVALGPIDERLTDKIDWSILR